MTSQRLKESGVTTTQRAMTLQAANPPLTFDDPATVTVWGDRTVKLHEKTYETSGALLTLPIPKFPFDLDVLGYKNVPISLMGAGVCTELQIEVAGEGNWSLFQMKSSFFPTMPAITE